MSIPIDDLMVTNSLAITVPSFYPGPLRLIDDEGERTFSPVSDITALEAVLIANLFVVVIQPTGGKWEWRKYLADNQLERHFK